MSKADMLLYYLVKMGDGRLTSDVKTFLLLNHNGYFLSNKDISNTMSYLRKRGDVIDDWVTVSGYSYFTNFLKPSNEDASTNETLDAKKELDALKKNNLDLSNRITELVKDNDELKDELASIRHKYDELKDKYDALKDELDAYHKQYGYEDDSPSYDDSINANLKAAFENAAKAMSIVANMYSK